jgi:G patch domain/KOW motif-containing protein
MADPTQKISFSLPKASKPHTHNRKKEVTPDYVTRIQNNQLQSANPKHKVQQEELVIPCTPNSFQPHVKLAERNAASNSIPQPVASSNVKIEESEESVDIKDDKSLSEQIAKNLSSGAVPSFLQVRKREDFADEEDDDVLSRFKQSSTSNDDDLESKSIPIADFGKALLRGMGWKEGKAYGRSDKVVEPFITQQRPRLAGLGSMVESHTSNEEEEGGILEELWMDKTTGNLVQNALVNIVDGPYDGLVGQILDQDADKRGRRNVRLNLPNKLRALVSESYLRPLPTALKRLDDNHEARRFARSVRVVSIRSTNDEAKQQPHDEEDEAEDRKPRKITWVTPNLRVRIISKRYGRGRYYNEKAVVVDVPTAYQCTVKRDGDSKLLEDLEERMLETIIPRELNTQVICVAGKYRGKRGRMVDKDRKRQMVTVQVSDEDAEDYGEVYTVPYDDVCEYKRLRA